MKVIPVIGATGAFTFSGPFSSYGADGVEYTCQAVRRISDYIANNEDVKTIAYTPYGVPDDIYEEDVKENAYIVSLQSSRGHWLIVPYRYIPNYQTGDGVVYCSKMVVFSLPSIPVAMDLTSFINDVESLITAQLGVIAVPKVVESSQPVLIDTTTHIEKQAARDLLKTQSSQAAEVYRLTQEVQRLTEENTILKNYIESL